MTGWFGKNWGAPCCAEDEHLPTPIGASCARCREPFKLGDQGIAQPLVGVDGTVSTIAYHIDCYLKGIQPHGPDCSHCRGIDIRDHDRGCAFRERGDNCDCSVSPFSDG